MTKIDRQPYSEERIEALLKYLRKYAEKGKPYDYRIMVNHSEVVHRTNDPEDFMDYETALNGGTQWVDVIIYIAAKVCEHHVFSIDDSAVDQAYGKDKKNNLNGTEGDETDLEKARQKWEEELERKNLLKENAELKESLKELEKSYQELEDQYDALEEEMEELRNRPYPYSEVLGNVGAQVLESLAKRNIDKIKDLPLLGGALAGLFSETPQQLPQGNPEKEPEGEVKVQMTVDDSKLKEFAQEEVMVQLLHECNTAFPKEVYEHVLLIVAKLRLNPSNIDTVLELLKDEND